MAAGLLFVVLGWIGLVVPVMPGFIFFLAAAFCFARGNPVWERRLLEHERIGPALRDWRERRAIPRPAKKTALVTMACSGALALWLTGFPLGLVSVAILAVAALYVGTRPE
jgi:uncharacterized membrane protein YbaN (DUF454 family)